jgi:hypothetical protein
MSQIMSQITGIAATSAKLAEASGTIPAIIIPKANEKPPLVLKDSSNGLPKIKNAD